MVRRPVIGPSTQLSFCVAELRPTSCDLGPLNRADGSARYSSGRTEVLVAVWGPVESGVDENYGEASVEAQFRPISGLPGD